MIRRLLNIKPVWWLYDISQRLSFSNSAHYWESRYAKGGKSGDGSYGKLAYFKAEILNNFVNEHNISSVLELGCGDGNQLTLANYSEYTGVDVSQSAVKMCQLKFADDPTKKFLTLDCYRKAPANVQLAISLDVIYHLVEDEVYNEHMAMLFGCHPAYVIIYSSNYEKQEYGAHVRHREFTRWIADNTQYVLVKKIENHYPKTRPDMSETIKTRIPLLRRFTHAAESSWSDFYVFALPKDHDG